MHKAKPQNVTESRLWTLFIGAHLSISKGYAEAVKTALAIGANTFQYFTRNPRGGKAKALDKSDLVESKQLTKEYGFFPPVAHAPYTINLAAADERIWDFAVRTMREDLQRAEEAGSLFLVVHPGSHVGQGIEAGIKRIIAALDQILSIEGSVMLLLEGMAGSGSEVGSSFEELKILREGVRRPERVGFALDTCHLYGAGYDIVKDLDGVLAEFDRTIGLEHLKVLHLNDSKQPLGSKKDRHADLGTGWLGEKFFAYLINHPIVKNLPLLLETPGDVLGYAREIAWLKTLKREEGEA